MCFLSTALAFQDHRLRLCPSSSPNTKLGSTFLNSPSGKGWSFCLLVKKLYLEVKMINSFVMQDARDSRPVFQVSATSPIYHLCVWLHNFSSAHTHTHSPRVCGSSICVVVCAMLSHTEMKTNIIQLPNLATKKKKKICNLNKNWKRLNLKVKLQWKDKWCRIKHARFFFKSLWLFRLLIRSFFFPNQNRIIPSQHPWCWDLRGSSVNMWQHCHQLGQCGTAR